MNRRLIAADSKLEATNRFHTMYGPNFKIIKVDMYRPRVNIDGKGDTLYEVTFDMKKDITALKFETYRGYRITFAKNHMYKDTFVEVKVDGHYVSSEKTKEQALKKAKNFINMYLK